MELKLNKLDLVILEIFASGVIIILLSNFREIHLLELGTDNTAIIEQGEALTGWQSAQNSFAQQEQYGEANYAKITQRGNTQSAIQAELVRKMK